MGGIMAPNRGGAPPAMTPPQGAVPKRSPTLWTSIAPKKNGQSTAPTGPWGMGAARSPQEAKPEPDEPDDGDNLKDFLKGAPVPGKQWENDAEDEEDEQVAQIQSAFDAKAQKNAEGAGLLAGVFGGSTPAFIKKHERDEIGETEEPLEPPAKIAR